MGFPKHLVLLAINNIPSVASPGPKGGCGLLVVTGKRKGRPRKDIVPDGLVQLRIQKFGTKCQKKITGGAAWRV